MSPQGARSKPKKPRVLCVDDEPSVLDGLSLTLGRRFDVATANSGAAALELLASDPSRAVILSDMRMPGMDGATFLARAREVAPEAVRMLLTGQTDMNAAIAAVNEGQIFRFLTKPCPPPQLLGSIAAAVEQHELIIAQRVLLEETLHGCIKALVEVLSLTNPAAFGRSTRIKRLVSDLASELGLRERWQVEVAAMLSQLGHITLPAATAERLYFQQQLSSDEQKLVDKLPDVTQQLLGSIPRIDAVRDILATYPKPQNDNARDTASSEVVRWGAQLLRVAVDFDSLESQGVDAHLAVDSLRKRSGLYDAAVLDALQALRGKDEVGEEICEVPMGELRTGMILMEDVRLMNGLLLAARGYEITPRFLERIHGFPAAALKQKMRVILRPSLSAEGSLARALGYRG